MTNFPPSAVRRWPKHLRAALLLAATMVAATVMPAVASAPDYTDVSADSAHAVSIDRLQSVDILEGFPDGTFRPSGTVNRGQFASMVARSLGLAEASTTDAFSDIAGTTHAGMIQALFDEEAIAGFPDGTFRPAAPVTRGQAATMLAQLLDLDLSGPVGDAPWFTDTAGTTHEVAIEALARFGVLRGSAAGTYLPSATLRRDQAASLFARTIDRGVVDATFGDQGTVVNAVRDNNQARGIAVGPQDHLFSVGHSWTDDSFGDFGNHLIRRTPDGRLDPTFGDAGLVAIDGPVPAFWEFLRPVPFDDGRVAVVGNAMTLSAVAFISAEGAIDVARGDDGYAVFEAAGDDEPGFMAFDAAADTEGRLIVVGDRFTMSDEGGPDPASRLAFVARLADDGTLDANFGDDGLVILDTDDARVQLRSVSIADDGKIVVTGRALADPTPELLLAALTPEGVLDAGFGDGGFSRPAPDGEPGRLGWRVAQDSDGGVIVIGNQGPFGSRDGFVLRANADGSLDTAFGDGGLRLLPDGFVTAMQVTDTHLWVGGQAGDIGAERGASVWRLTLAGDLDSALGLGGQSVLTFPSRATGEAIGAIAGLTSADGSILLHGIDADAALIVVSLRP